MNAEQILESLINDVADPSKANGAVAVAHANLARVYFEKKEKDAIQERSAKTKVSRASGKGGDGPKDAAPVGSGDAPKQETTRSRAALLPSRNA